MNLPSPENLLSTNEAAKLSCYSADYLARLGKSGKIKATRIGRSWFLDRNSFIAFVGEQGDRKEAHARAYVKRSIENIVRRYGARSRHSLRLCHKQPSHSRHPFLRMSFRRSLPC